MRMKHALGTAALVVAGLLLAGCASTPPAATEAASSSPSATPTPTPVVAIGLVISLDEISLTMSDGSKSSSTPFSDGPAVLALLSRELGSTPVPAQDDTYGYTGYDWGGLSLALNNNDNNSAGVTFTVDKVGSLVLSTVEGIRVGSTLADVQKVASPGTESESAGSSYAYFGLEARTHPGTDSLTFPGRVGVDYIEIQLNDGVVNRIGVPGGDWRDI